jgi:hypothetical protein
MPRILKNLRIDEVSAVMKSAGVGTKVVDHETRHQR